MRKRVAIPLVLVVLVTLSAALLAQGGRIAQGGRKVSGTVLDGSGLPVAGAAVRYDEVGLPTQNTTTDAKGYFEVSAGRLGVVTVTARNFGTARRRWPPVRGSQLRVVMESPSVLEGTVRDAATGRGLDAVVTVMLQDPLNGIVSMSAEAFSGTFRVEDLPSGPAVVMASAEGYAPTWSQVTIEAKDLSTAQLRLKLEAFASGTVVNASGSAVPGAYVSVVYTDEAGAYGMLESQVGGVPWSDAEGRFGLMGLIPDVPITFQAESDDGSLSNAVTVTIPPGSVRQNIALQFP